MKMVFGVGYFARYHSIPPAPKAVRFIFAPPFHKVITGAKNFWLYLFNPFLVARISVILAQRPQHGAGLARITLVIRYRAVLILLVQEISERAFGNILSPHGVAELNDGSALRSDRAIVTHVWRQISFGFIAISD